jgi:hypothetical protein
VIAGSATSTHTQIYPKYQWHRMSANYQKKHRPEQRLLNVPLGDVEHHFQESVGDVFFLVVMFIT